MTKPKEKRTINGQIQTQIDSTLNLQPHPTTATVTHIYPDGYVDIKTNYGELKHVPSIINHEIGDKTILIFLENDYNQRMII